MDSMWVPRLQVSAEQYVGAVSRGQRRRFKSCYRICADISQNRRRALVKVFRPTSSL